MDELLEDIFSAIKTDNLKSFTTFMEDNANLYLSYGRFPLLSLCYLYKSRKIIRAYEKQLSAITAYTCVMEDAEMYDKFKTYAKTCLRLYTIERNIVSPLEMLAILKETYYLKLKFSAFNKNEKIIANIANIYLKLHNREIITDKKDIKIKRNNLKRLQKVRIIAIVMLTVVMIVFSHLSQDAIFYFYGSGDANNPIKITSETQLIAAFMQGDKHYILTNDITIEKEWESVDFSGNINGGGHTLYVKEHMNNGFIKNLYGRLENINLVFSDMSKDILDNFSLLVNSNYGVINDVNLYVNAAFTESSDLENLYVSLMVYENNNTISNCSVDGKVSFTGDGVKNAYLSAIAAINSGTITNSITAVGSSLITNTVDVSGVVLENKADAIVSECVNNAQIIQTSHSENWLPHASGVVLINDGIVRDCVNNGNITAISEATENLLEVHAAGVVCINNNTIEKSKNNADITGISHSFYVYAGGIVSLNNNQTAVIDNSCSYGLITISSSVVEKYLFAGGIAAYNIGLIKNSYSASTFNTENTEAFLGGIIGIIFLDISDYLGNRIMAHNNFYVNQDNVSFGIGIFLFNNTLYEGSNNGAVAVAGLSALQELEVYWDD